MQINKLNQKIKKYLMKIGCFFSILKDILDEDREQMTRQDNA